VRRERLCRAEAVADGTGRGFRFGAGTDRVAVFVIRSGGTLHAYVNACPHIGTPLDWLQDRFFDRTGEHLVCGTHGALFRPEDGLCVRGPCVGKRLAPVPMSIEDGVIVLELRAPENS
jgi:nitrite reductase/ring-hydroxylating ferredoxin subunit